MKILEVKNNLVKISYNTEDNLHLAGFVVIEDKNSPYVAQVVNLKADNGLNLAVLKLLFTFNAEGVLKNYDGSIPSTEATLTVLPAVELLDILPSENPVYLGLVSGDETPFKLDMSSLNSNLLICSDNIENTGHILNNFIPQIAQTEKKAILIDVNGEFKSLDSFSFGTNFKLPLNAEFIDYIFENDLQGVEPVSKAIIQDVFNEVKSYLDTLPQGYLPIDLFINVVQEQYQETKIPELVLLKNRLIRYMDDNVFAAGKDSAVMLRDKVAHSDSLVIDISSADKQLKRKLISFIYDAIATVNADTLVFAPMDNDIADKPLLRKTLEYQNVCTTIICSHSFKYLPDLKQIIQNMILFAPQTVQHDFASYNTFLAKLGADEFIVYGPSTQNIPFIVKLEHWEDIVEAQEKHDGVDFGSDTENSENNQPEEQADDIFDTNADSFLDEEVSLDENNESFESELDKQESENSEISSESENLVDTDGNDVLDNTEDGDANSEFPSTGSTGDDTDFFADDEISSLEQDVLNDRSELENEVAKDVDASFYKKLDEDSLDKENDVNPEIFDNLEDDSELSEEDLDYIQSMPSQNENQEVYSADDFASLGEETTEEVLTDDVIDDFDDNTLEIAEEDKQNEKTPVVPVYTPPEFDTGVVDVSNTFESGDIVSHPKYGQGVVEKMINYGNKTLCSISFVNIGRRLLDPNISDLTLVERSGARGA